MPLPVWSCIWAVQYATYEAATLIRQLTSPEFFNNVYQLWGISKAEQNFTKI